MNKELIYIDKIIKSSRHLSLENNKIYMYIERDKYTYNNMTLSSNIIGRLRKNDIIFSTEYFHTIRSLKISINLSDVTMKMRNDKINSILND